MLLDGTRVLIGAQAAPLFSVSYDSIRLQVPFDANATTLRLERDGVLSDPVPLMIVSSRPYLFGVQDAAGNRVDTLSPSQAVTIGSGTRFTLFGYGFGLTNPPAPSGAPTPQPALFGPRAYQVPVTLHTYVAGKGSQNLMARLTPGLIGVYEVTTMIPPLPTGVVGPVPIWFEVEGSNPSNQIGVWVK